MPHLAPKRPPKLPYPLRRKPKNRLYTRPRRAQNTGQRYSQRTLPSVRVSFVANVRVQKILNNVPVQHWTPRRTIGFHYCVRRLGISLVALKSGYVLACCCARHAASAKAISRSRSFIHSTPSARVRLRVSRSLSCAVRYFERVRRGQIRSCRHQRAICANGSQRCILHRCLTIFRP